MRAQDVRKKFLDFFEKRGHVVRPSSSLIQHEDPTVLFTTAGMQQFKPYFLGEKNAKKDLGSKRVVTVQRCLRTSDAVDETHLTFFEMLGNFSFGDYFKKEAIEFAWIFLTKEMRLDPTRLWVTIFGGDAVTPFDAESLKAWQGMHAFTHPVTRGGRGTNWWGPTGETGPCGPSSEVHYDLTHIPCAKKDRCLPNCDCGRFLELWNLVFTEYEKTNSGAFKPLPAKNIDTGLGLDRLVFLVARKESIFATDLFAPIIALLRKSSAFGQLEQGAKNRQRERIVADHLRAAVALIADGVEMSNKDQGYVLRKMTRACIDQLIDPRIDFAPFVDAVIAILSPAYPFLAGFRGRAVAVLNAELRLYERVLKLDVSKIVEKIKTAHHPPAKETFLGPSARFLSPEEAFQLFTTYGLSPERLQREGYTFDMVAFQAKIGEHQAISRAGAVKKFGGHGVTAGHGVKAIPLENAADLSRIKRLHTATHLLQQALRDVLGKQVKQMGSDITTERLRFDFTHPQKLTPDELAKVEALVNEKIAQDLPQKVEEMPYEDAIASSALAFFKERYPERVTVYSFGDWSKEICGGPHVDHSAEVGKFRIVSEKSTAAGIRRIKAVVE